MGLATAPIVKNSVNIIRGTFGISCSNSRSSMSQGFHRGIYSFSEGTSAQDQHHHDQQQQQQPHHIAQQSRRDKLRVQSGFDPPLVPIVHQEEVVGGGIYEAATGSSNMLSEMFNFNTVMAQGGVVGGPSASELLASQMQAGGYHLPPSRAPLTGFGPTGDSTWYNNNSNNKGVSGGQVINLGGNSMVDHMKVAPQLNAHDSVTAMQLFLMDPAQSHDPRSPSPPPPPPQALFGVVGSTHQHHHQGLSLSLSSSLQTAANQDQLRLRDGVLYFNNNDNNNHSSSSNIPLLQGQQSQGHHMGYGVVNVLRNSKYSRAAQELLEEFCSVGREQFKRRSSRNQQYGSSSSNPNPNNPNAASTSANAGAGSSSSSKDVPSLSPADRFEHQRKKSKLLSMLDEVDRRYNYYCDQMQMVVKSFDSVMGFGAATPYTALARKAMSRHFRCLKDAIAEQLKRTCELLGEREVGSSSGVTRGETPRLRLLDQGLRQQRAFHQMGMLEQEAWRPQRGLPERSVTILRAWLFEHFLHPYPSDADKHLLARQTGLSRNQVSNWFINARVRLWKPMIEEMYQQEAQEQAEAEAGNNRDDDVNNQQTPQSPTNQVQVQMQNQQRLETDAQLERFPGSTSIASAHDVANIPILHMIADTPEICGPHDDLYREYEAAGLGPAARMRLGTTGDVSLTLGLRHAGGNNNNNNAPEKNRPFTIRDFGG